MIRVWHTESSSEEDWTHATLLNPKVFMRHGLKTMSAVPLADRFPPATLEILSKLRSLGFRLTRFIRRRQYLVASGTA